MQTIYLLGTAKWARLREDNGDTKFNKWGLDLYLSEGSWETFNNANLPLKIREDDDGKFVKLSRGFFTSAGESRNPPVVLRHNDEDDVYEPFEGNIGNGSLVNCKVLTGVSKRGVWHLLEAVAVENLVEYENEQEIDMPF